MPDTFGLVFPTSLNLENRKPGYAGALNANQVKLLKKTWTHLFTLFLQPGEEIETRSTATTTNEPNKADTKKGGFFGFGGSSKKNETVQDVFLGATSDPRWTSLPLEKALPMIPGHLLRDAFWGMVGTNNPDATLLRFLRARKWDFEASYNMLTNTLRWRIEMRINEIVSLGEGGLIRELDKLKEGMGKAFKKQLSSEMVTLGGPDRGARGICFVNVSVYHKEDQPLEIMKLMTIYIMETSRVVCDYPMDSVCIVFSLENFTLANMDMEAVKFLVNCFQAYYPETLGLCCVYKAPMLFSAIWNLIKPILDPVVAGKINFTRNLKDLEAHVAPDSLPKFITGNPESHTLDDMPDPAEPKPGFYPPPPEDPLVKQYWETVADFEQNTEEWTKVQEFGSDEDALNRLKLAQKYRISRIKEEKVVRGETSYHLKGLIRVDENDRLWIGYQTSTWGEKDITEWV